MHERFSNYAINYCINNNTLGLRLNNGSCIPFDSSKSIIQKSTDIKTTPSSGSSYRRLKYPKSSNNKQNIQDVSEESQTISINDISLDPINQNECIEKNSDYGKICQNRFGNQYGVKKIQKCNASNGVKVICDKMFFNGKDYKDHNTFATDCFDKSLDFDALCNQYMPKNIKNKSRPNGYNINSAGVSEKLYGVQGSCYLNNGESDNSKVRGICNLKSDQTLPRLSPFVYLNNKEINDYNKFTGCGNIETTNFVGKCSKLLNIPKNQVFADINGYDCLPGYGRAKCVNKTKDLNPSHEMKKFLLDSKSQSLYPYTISN